MCHGRLGGCNSLPVPPPSGWKQTDKCVALWHEYYKQCEDYRIAHAGCMQSRGGGVDQIGVGSVDFVERSNFVGSRESISRPFGLLVKGDVRSCHAIEVGPGGGFNGSSPVDECPSGTSPGGKTVREPGFVVGQESEVGGDCHSEFRSVEETRAAVGGTGVAVGPNYERNCRNREAKRQRKVQRQQMNVDWRRPKVVVKSEGESQGFWNSCSPAVRQELIDSKARMHVAQNEHRAQEAKERVDAMRSPIAIMKKAVALAEQASKIAKKEGDSKVMGWAQTVATSEAESLARSTPSSVPSFDEVHKSVSDVEVDEVFTPDSSLVSENENLKAKVKAMQLEKKLEGERVAVEKHAAVLARVAELEKQVLVQQKKKKPAYNDIVCDGMTEWQIKDLKKKNEALEREVDEAYRWKAKQDVVKQGVTGSIWFGKQAAKK